MKHITKSLSGDTILTLIAILIVCASYGLLHVFCTFLPLEVQKYIANRFLVIMGLGAVVWMVKSFIFIVLWNYGKE